VLFEAPVATPLCVGAGEVEGRLGDHVGNSHRGTAEEWVGGRAGDTDRLGVEVPHFEARRVEGAVDEREVDGAVPWTAAGVEQAPDPEPSMARQQQWGETPMLLEPRDTTVQTDSQPLLPIRHEPSGDQLRSWAVSERLRRWRWPPRRRLRWAGLA
jgi:hypothetical protein